VSFRRYKL